MHSNYCNCPLNGTVQFNNAFNHIALRKAKIVCNFGLSECNRVKHLKEKDSVDPDQNASWKLSDLDLHCLVRSIGPILRILWNIQ